MAIEMNNNQHQDQEIDITNNEEKANNQAITVNNIYISQMDNKNVKTVLKLLNNFST